MLQRLRSSLRAAFSRQQFEADMAEELRFHIEQYAEDLVRSGLSREEANRRARIEFGGRNSVEGECREARGLQLADELTREVRYAVRSLRKAPGFTVTAVLTLALCLGANLTIFAVIHAILLRPLPFPNPNRLVTVYNTYPRAGVDRDGSSVTNYYERRGHIAAFDSVSIYRFGTAVVGEPGSTERLPVTQVSPEFFATLGRKPLLGRSFKEEETSFQADHVAILSNIYWRQHFHGDGNVTGRRLRVNGRPVTIVGVLPDGFRFLSSEAQLYFPLSSRPEDRTPAQRHSGGNVTQMIARLKPGATIAQAQTEIDAQNAALEASNPNGKLMAEAGFRSVVASLHGDHVASVRPTLVLLQTGVLLLLVIGSVNLTNLFLIRAGVRVRELAVRQALGASRVHMIREALVETTILSITGAALGLLVGHSGIQFVSWLGADRLPLGSQIGFDSQLALVAFFAAMAMGILLAAPIAWFKVRNHANDALKSETRSGTAGQTALRLRHALIVVQIAFAFVLLGGSCLLAFSLRRAMAVSPGFQAGSVLTAQIPLVGNKYPSPGEGLAFHERLMSELSRQPGVVSAGVVNNIPFSGYSGKSAAEVIGHVLQPGESPHGHYSYGVGGNYFRAMGFALREGRFLEPADSRRRERVCVVDENFARYYWPNDSALGHRLFQGSGVKPEAEAFTVVGVVGSVKQAALTDEGAQGAVYYPYIYRPESNVFVVVRGSVQPEAMALTLQKVVRQIDPELTVNDVRPMDDRIADSLVSRRSPALLAGVFSAIALLLTAIGTYGVLTYAVTQRRREIGVRMALGAQPAQIRGQFLRMALQLLASGATLGLLGMWMTGRALEAVLYHVEALDAVAQGVAIVVVAVVSLGACLLPAHRASKITPLEALAES